MQIPRSSYGCHEWNSLEMGPRHLLFKQVLQEVFMYILKFVNHYKWNIIHIRTWLPSFSYPYPYTTTPNPKFQTHHYCLLLWAAIKASYSPPSFLSLNMVKQPNYMEYAMAAAMLVPQGNYIIDLWHTVLVVTRITSEPPPSSLQESHVLSETPTMYLLLRPWGEGNRCMLGKVRVVCCI